MATCKHRTCVLTSSKAGYCNAHYIRNRRGGNMDAPVRRAASDPERFWQKVEKSNGCWEWRAYRAPDGYGRFMVDRVPNLAHRVSFRITNGPIPDGMEIDHMCHNRGCVNPEHLRLATGALNGQNLSGARSDSASGIRGVFWRKDTGRWRAEAKAGSKRASLGCFDSAEAAEAAVTEWRRANMPYSLMDQKVV